MLFEVINLSVEYYLYRAVFIRHRLVSGGAQVDDRQTPMAESYTRPNVGTFVVWSPMRECVAHELDDSFIDRIEGLAVDYAADSTHGFTSC